MEAPDCYPLCMEWYALPTWEAVIELGYCNKLFELWYRWDEEWGQYIVVFVATPLLGAMERYFLGLNYEQYIPAQDEHAHTWERWGRAQTVDMRGILLQTLRLILPMPP